MYHEQTPAIIARRRRRMVTVAVIAVALAVVCWLGYNAAYESMREQGAASIRSAILDSAMQCCAIEGSYPTTLAHLEEKYGLTINRDEYVITYEAFADNIMPSVVVVPR